MKPEDRSAVEEALALVAAALDDCPVNGEARAELLRQAVFDVTYRTQAPVYVVAYPSPGGILGRHYPLRHAEGERGVPKWFNTPAQARAWARDTFDEDARVLRVAWAYEAVSDG